MLLIKEDRLHILATRCVPLPGTFILGFLNLPTNPAERVQFSYDETRSGAVGRGWASTGPSAVINSVVLPGTNGAFVSAWIGEIGGGGSGPVAKGLVQQFDQKQYIVLGSTTRARAQNRAPHISTAALNGIPALANPAIPFGSQGNSTLMGVTHAAQGNLLLGIDAAGDPGIPLVGNQTRLLPQSLLYPSGGLFETLGTI